MAFVKVRTDYVMILSDDEKDHLLSAPSDMIANFLANQSNSANGMVNRVKNFMPDSIRWTGKSSFVIERPPRTLELVDAKNETSYFYRMPWMVYAFISARADLGSYLEVFAYARPGPLTSLQDPLYESAFPGLVRKEMKSGEDRLTFSSLDTAKYFPRSLSRSASDPVGSINYYLDAYCNAFDTDDVISSSNLIHEDVLSHYTDADSSRFHAASYLNDYSELSVKDSCLLKRKLAFESFQEFTSLLDSLSFDGSRIFRDLSTRNSDVVQMFTAIMHEASIAYGFTLLGDWSGEYGHHESPDPEYCEHEDVEDYECLSCGYHFEEEEVSPF